MYGKFEEHKSFEDIIKLEYQRYKNTDNEQKVQLKKHLQKQSGKLELKDWFVLVTSLGITPEVISEVSGLPIPDNLYYFIEEQRNCLAKRPDQVLYETNHFSETVCMYFDHLKAQNELKSDFHFRGKIIGVLTNAQSQNMRNILILDRTCFYPTSGG